MTHVLVVGLSGYFFWPSGVLGILGLVPYAVSLSHLLIRNLTLMCLEIMLETIEILCVLHK